jgi:hypothetical protein
MNSQNTNEEFPDAELVWTESAERDYEQGLITAGEATRSSSLDLGPFPIKADSSEQITLSESDLPAPRRIGRAAFKGTRRPRTVREQRSADVRNSGDPHRQ